MFHTRPLRRYLPVGHVVSVLLVMLLAMPTASHAAGPRAAPTTLRDGRGPSHPLVSPDEPQEMGVKTQAIVKALQLLAKGIRKGDKYANKVIGQLDDVSRAVYRTHSVAIADKLDKLAELTDVTVNVVKEQIIVLLNAGLGVQYTIAQDIGEVIAIVLSALL